MIMQAFSFSPKGYNKALAEGQISLGQRPKPSAGVRRKPAYQGLFSSKSKNNFFVLKQTLYCLI